MSRESQRQALEPRFRGFNLQAKFNASYGNAPFSEADFALIAEWGFNFVRLPLSYRCWSDPRCWTRVDEQCMSEIDEAVAWGKEYGLHVCLNFHRAPGYSVNRSVEEPFCLWTDEEALEACVYHWQHFAKRYQAIGDRYLSFDLINEPAFHSPSGSRFVTVSEYVSVLRELVGAIREVSSSRPIFVEGGAWGTLPIDLSEVGEGLWHSAHCYAPVEVTHWKAPFMSGKEWNACPPTWPLNDAEAGEQNLRSRAELLQRFYGAQIGSRSRIFPELGDGLDADWLAATLSPWKELSEKGEFVHVGEFGVYQETPHTVALSWLGDALEIFRNIGLGWALWELRGPFGVIDSNRKDVRYEKLAGEKVDRKMLELLRASV